MINWPRNRMNQEKLFFCWWVIALPPSNLWLRVTGVDPHGSVECARSALWRQGRFIPLPSLRRCYVEMIQMGEISDVQSVGYVGYVGCWVVILVVQLNICWLHVRNLFETPHRNWHRWRPQHTEFETRNLEIPWGQFATTKLLSNF